MMNPTTTPEDEIVIQLLKQSFETNKASLFVVKPGKKRPKRFEKLLRYSVFKGKTTGQVLLSDDQKACAILIESQKNKNSFSLFIKDLELIINCIGVFRLPRVLKRERIIKKHHPKDDFIHLWYLGVDPKEQGKGKGAKLLGEIKTLADKKNCPIYLETSIESNHQFYTKHGFECFAEINSLSYPFKLYRYTPTKYFS